MTELEDFKIRQIAALDEQLEHLQRLRIKYETSYRKATDPQTQQIQLSKAYEYRSRAGLLFDFAVSAGICTQVEAVEKAERYGFTT